MASRKAYKVSTRNSVYYVLVSTYKVGFKTQVEMKAWRLSDGLFFHSDRADFRMGETLVGENGNRRIRSSTILAVDRVTVKQLMDATP